MQVSVETTSAIERRVTISVPAAEVDQTVEKKLRELASRVRIAGFRPGKVPFKIVKQRYGASVRQEVMGEVMNKHYMKALQQENIQPAGYPEVEPRVIDEGKDFEFVATIEVFPHISICDFAKLTVENPQVELSEQDIQDTIQQLREQSASWEEVEKIAEQDDQVVICYKGMRDGEAFEGGSADNSNLELGSGRMIPGFEDAIVGMKNGEQKTVKLNFPEDYHVENLKGAAVEFEIEVKAVKCKRIPELNAAFFEKFEIEEGTEEAFVAKVRENVQKSLEQRVKDKVKQEVMDGLVKEHSAVVPKALLKAEIDALRQQAVQRFGAMNGADLDFSSMLPDELFTEDAERRAKLGLIVSTIATEKKLQVDEARVDALIEGFAENYQDPEQVRSYYSQDQMRSGLRSLVMEDMVVEAVLEKANQQAKVMSYKELMSLTPSAV